MAAAKNLVYGHIHPLMNEWCTLLGHFCVHSFGKSFVQ